VTRIVPTQLPFLDQETEGGGGEGLGVGTRWRRACRVDGGGRALALDTVALGQNDAAVLDHGHGDAGDVELAPGPLDVRVDRGEGRSGGGRGR
jgi:hypothetical protein